ncbi:hypothetical protein AAULR_24061, partial [Lacticaseibacillus rhamnosus MTCC 5462]
MLRKLEDKIETEEQKVNPSYTLTKVTFHGLRHSHVSYLLSK